MRIGNSTHPILSGTPGIASARAITATISELPLSNCSIACGSKLPNGTSTVRSEANKCRATLAVRFVVNGSFLSEKRDDEKVFPHLKRMHLSKAYLRAFEIN